VHIANVWKGDRNPVRYSSLDCIGIDPSSLKWEVMPEPINATEPVDQGSKTFGVKPLTMVEAKRGLALTFNVAAESIEIIIRG
jgi:hypothetical protein